MIILLKRMFKWISGRSGCRKVAACFVLCGLFYPGMLLADLQESRKAPEKELRFGAIQGIYPNVDRNDGRLALELLMQKTIHKNAYPYGVKLSFIDPQTDIPAAIERGGYHFVTLSSIDYFKYHQTVVLDPILIPSKIEQPTEQLLFLVAKDQDLSTIAKKEGRSLIIETGSSGDLSRLWLDTLLQGNGYPDSKRYFTNIRRVSKPGRAIIPVFFGQADACIITRHALKVIKELNPQMDQRVKILFQSEGLVRLMICSTDKPSQKAVATLIRETTVMDKNPDTRQAMTILQMKCFLPVLPEDLAATKKLLAHHSQIKAAQNQ